MKKNKHHLKDRILLVCLLAVASVLLFRQSFPLGIVFTVLTVCCAAYVFAGDDNGKFHFFRYRSKSLDAILPTVLKNTNQPIAIISDQNKIIWANKSFEYLPEMASRTVLPPADKLFDGSLSYEAVEDSYNQQKECIDLNTETTSYQIGILPLSTKKSRYFGLTFTDNSELLKIRSELRDTNSVVVVAALDNASELTQDSNESFRLTSAKIALELSKWAKKHNGLIMEYEDGRFMMLFERKQLDLMEEDKFSILDEICNLSSNDFSSPLTVSIGVSEEEGTLDEKLTAAQNALRIAFQKGGAIAIVKTNEGYKTFGGKTKTVQKQTSIRSRICRDLLINNIRTCSNVLVMGHWRPDFDSIGSNVGIARLALFLGKPVNIVIDRSESNIENAFPMLENLPDYAEMFVDPRRAMDLMTPYTLLVCTDVSNPNQFFAPDLYENAQRVIVIDHHSLEAPLSENVLQPANIDPNASSASELVSEILELALPDGTLCPEEAQVMLSGILLDTMFFSHDTGSRTFRSCSYLRTAGADPTKVKNMFKSDLNEFERTNRFLQNKYIFRDHFMITFFDGEKDPQNMVAASKAANQLVEIDGIVASFALYPLENGISVSARSDGTFNVVNIVRPLGGGGHFQAAGARLLADNEPVLDMKAARKLLEQAIDDYCENTERR